MNQVLYNIHTFTQGALQIHFYFDENFAQFCEIHDVVFEEFVPEIDDYRLIGEGEMQRFADPQRYDVYINVGVGPAANHLVRARAYVGYDDWTPSNLPCCVERERIDGRDYWVFTFHFVDLSAMQKSILKKMDFTCEDDCKVPMEVLNCMMKMFAINIAADTNDSTLERIYSKFISNTKSNFRSSGCNCNG